MATLRALLAIVTIPTLALAQQHVTFPTQDNALIYADVYGSGPRGVVLAHGGRFKKEGWEKQARVLANAGFRVVAIDYRGEGPAQGGTGSEDSGGRFDVLAAVHYLKRTGASWMGVVGASMGGDFAAEAAEMEPAEIDRIVLLAAGAYTPLTKMKGRKLFIVARDDANTDGPRLPKIRAQFEKAVEPKQLIVLDGSAHAQFLFETNQGDRVMREILHFLSAP